jgi:hypothetical protein
MQREHQQNQGSTGASDGAALGLSLDSSELSFFETV